MRRLALTTLAALGLTLTACTPEPPEVTFFAAGETVRLSPTDTCNGEIEECKPTGNLAVPGGKPLNISVPSQVAKSPWVVVFKFRAADGSEQKARSTIFKANERYAYTLTLPTAGDQLLHVEVQRIEGIAADPTQGLTYQTNPVWSLNISQ
ncbi:DUF2771 family protein [Actinocrispum sp. NPDC049592]|uniref:DUF2771 family protein n=1 Tax=Actinocrispum sp. NPDC049592 TaxID=3154835 RepID=UPI00343B7E99